MNPMNPPKPNKPLRKRAKLKKVLNQTNLLKKYEQVMKPIIIERDGARCAIAGYRHTCTYTQSLVVDHRPSSRSNHSTFFDPRNLTCVCQGANGRAETDPFVSKAIMDIVEKREGAEVLHEIALASRKSRKWEESEITEWIDECREYFRTCKSGAPKEKIKIKIPEPKRNFLKG